MSVCACFSLCLSVCMCLCVCGCGGGGVRGYYVFEILKDFINDNKPILSIDGPKLDTAVANLREIIRINPDLITKLGTIIPDDIYYV